MRRWAIRTRPTQRFPFRRNGKAVGFLAPRNVAFEAFFLWVQGRLLHGGEFCRSALVLAHVYSIMILFGFVDQATIYTMLYDRWIDATMFQIIHSIAKVRGWFWQHKGLGGRHGFGFK